MRHAAHGAKKAKQQNDSLLSERFVYGVFTPLQFLVFNGLSGVVGL